MYYVSVYLLTMLEQLSVCHLLLWRQSKLCKMRNYESRIVKDKKRIFDRQICLNRKLIRLRPLPSKSFPIYQLSLYAVLLTLTTSANNQQTDLDIKLHILKLKINNLMFLFEDLIVNTTNTSNNKPIKSYLHWLQLIAATYFGQYLGPSPGRIIKWDSCYWNILIWIHISIKSVIINNVWYC
jgi:hypothetical protein